MLKQIRSFVVTSVSLKFSAGASAQDVAAALQSGPVETASLLASAFVERATITETRRIVLDARGREIAPEQDEPIAIDAISAVRR
jgi:hypothetical protein